MTLDREAQQLLLSPGSYLHQRMMKKSGLYERKDRLDYLKLGWQGERAVKALLEKFLIRMKEATENGLI